MYLYSIYILFTKIMILFVFNLFNYLLNYLIYFIWIFNKVFIFLVLHLFIIY